MNSTVSALLTVLVLLAGFTAASLAYVNVYAVKAAELRESYLEAEAASELLHAYIYRDVSTNASLLTLRNAGKTALEITSVVLVDRAGNVVKTVALNETIKLSPQQYRTMPFSAIAGREYSNYTETFDSLSAAYFKTFRGRVFGSRYLTPPVVEVAAYQTSYTTQTTQVTSSEQLTVVETSETVATWTATVIIDNPSHWPIKVYTGVAYPRGPYREDVTFPSWGLIPGLQAKDFRNTIVNVTDPSTIKIPQFVTIYQKGSPISTSLPMWDPCDRRAWRFTSATPFSIWRPIPTTDYGPKFVALIDETVTICEQRSRPSIPVRGAEYFFPDNTMRNTDNRTTITFPTNLEWHTGYYVERYVYSYYLLRTSYFSSAIHKLAYVAVVDLWNTTNVVAYSTNGTLNIRADRPLGIVAVYTYDRTNERLPPPPPPPSPPQCMKSYTANICESSDVGTQVWTDSGVGVTVPCDSPPPDSVSVSFGTSNPDKCDAYIAPGAGTYSTGDVQACDKSGNTITCNVPPGATIITDCKH